MSKKFFNLFLIALSILFVACKKENIIYIKYFDLPSSKWSYNDSILFKWNIQDTSSVYNVDFQLRASSSYKWSNIFIFSDVFFPNGKARRDTFEYFLADKNGHWIGERSGLIVQYDLPIYKNVKFPISGNYDFLLLQGMRDTILNEIVNVGVKITRVKD
tara:strand:+ start:13532 stop:14008 length:477 start_codon:yes stop_codon:yes gene_type:complete